MLCAYFRLGSPGDVRSRAPADQRVGQPVHTLISSARMATGNPDVVKAQLEATKPPTVHPLVRTHPDTGTKAVWFHKGKTETVTGMSPEETQDFLQDLTDKITQPQFCYAHEYKRATC
jgi:alpha-ketoglutarate-dependent taurine dioxygenase